MKKQKAQPAGVTSAPVFRLNYPRIFIIGFAFFGILMLWQVYNTYCPVILTELLVSGPLKGQTEAAVQWVVGIIMALDNVLALVMLPVFGMLSDRTHSRLGKRMPYIIVGTILASIALPFIPVAFACDSLAGVIIVMMLVLLFMNIYRNPAVSLMPDITPKPLRAKANGIINLVGYIGAILAGGIALFVKTGKYFKAAIVGTVLNANENYKNGLMYLPFIVASVLMLVTMIILAVTIKENKVLAEMEDEMKRGEASADVEEPLIEGAGLSKKNKRNLILIIAAVFLWFAAFNAVETFWSNYCTYYIDFESFAMATIILTIASLISFIPAGILAEKVGRKWAVLIGIIICAVVLGVCFFLSPAIIGERGLIDSGGSGGLKFVYFFLFALAGVGWAFINCSSYPMVVELSTQKNIGRYTGYYYSFSMLAQSLTPIVFGAIMRGVEGHPWAVLFPYSTLLFIMALIVFCFISPSKNVKPRRKKGLEAFDQDN